jgi:hypothetical protein
MRVPQAAFGAVKDLQKAQAEKIEIIAMAADRE